MCDIEQMFYSFHVNPLHRDFLRFLWFEGNTAGKPIIEYRMNVHLFGNGPSPAVATFGLRKTASDGEEEFGKAAMNFVHCNFYVDDGLTSLPTAAQAIDLVTTTQAMLATANLRLYKVVSNSVEVMEASQMKTEEKTCAISTYVMTAYHLNGHSAYTGTSNKTFSPSRLISPRSHSREEECYP